MCLRRPTAVRLILVGLGCVLSDITVAQSHSEMDHADAHSGQSEVTDDSPSFLGWTGDAHAFFSTVLTHTDGNPSPAEAAPDAIALADALLTAERGSLRVLAEYVLSTEEGDLERLQLGWKPNPGSIVWVGRYHQPSSFWAHTYHHGQFLQTTITRPLIDSWEDDGGPLPQHFTGALFDSTQTTKSGSRIDFSMASGIAPELHDGELQPYDIFHHRSYRLKPTYAARVALAPNALDDNLVGLAASHSEVANNQTAAIPGTAVSHYDLTTVGAFLDWSERHWRLVSALYYVDTSLEGEGDGRHHAFWASYAQAEVDIAAVWHPFVRHERFDNVTGVTYLQQFDHVFNTKWLIGARWDVARKQALTAEITRTEKYSGAFNEYRLQWSAAFP